MIATYILFSQKDRKTYVGYSCNLTDRLRNHRLGLVSATRNRRPLSLIAYRPASNIEDARKIEKYWKTASGRRFLKKILIDINTRR